MQSSKSELRLASGSALATMQNPLNSYCKLLHSTSAVKPSFQHRLDAIVRTLSISSQLQSKLQMTAIRLSRIILITYASDSHSKLYAGNCTRGIIARIMAGSTPHISYKFYRRSWNSHQVWNARRVWLTGTLIIPLCSLRLPHTQI
jgi:hypothetical protein